MELKEFLKDMDGPHYRSAVVRIADACNVTTVTVSRWVKNDTRIRPIFKRAINAEFNREIFKL